MKLPRKIPEGDDRSDGRGSREDSSTEPRRSRDDRGPRERRHHDDQSYPGPERRLRTR